MGNVIANSIYSLGLYNVSKVPEKGDMVSCVLTSAVDGRSIFYQELKDSFSDMRGSTRVSTCRRNGVYAAAPRRVRVHALLKH